MTPQPTLTFIATHDLSAHTRGRTVPTSDAVAGLRRGVGWVPANIAIGAFGHIAERNEFGAAGDLRLRPDPATQVDLPSRGGKPGIRFMLADQVLPDGSEWDCCPRTFARRALEEFTAATGLSVHTSFEHEFVVRNLEAQHQSFTFARFRDLEPFGTELFQLMETVGLEPETWLPEYGDGQFEVTMAPAEGITGADRAVLLRDVVHDLASRQGYHVTFAPLTHPGGSGNGVHVHLSFRDVQTGQPVLFDPKQPANLAEVGHRLASGMVHHGQALAALTAPGPSSHLRLAPGNWSVGGAFLAERNREAMVRICPTSTLGGGEPAHQFNLEYRTADATSNPYIVLGALLHAALEGVRGRAPLKTLHPEDASPETMAATPQLHASMQAGTDALRADDVLAGWFPPRMFQTLLDIREADHAAVEKMTDEEVCHSVVEAY